MALGRGLHAYRVWALCCVCSIYRRKGVCQRDDTADSNDPNMYVRDVVAVFKFFAGAHPPVKKISHHHYVAAQALRSRTHVSAFALVVY